MALSALKPGANLQDPARKATEEARAANEKRYQEALGLTDQMMALYGPDFQKGAEAELVRAKQQSVDQGMNALIQSGLGATGGAASLATAWEQSVGSEARLKLEDLIAQNKAAALQSKINVIASKEDMYPDYAQIYSGAAGAAAARGYSMNYTPGFRDSIENSGPLTRAPARSRIIVATGTPSVPTASTKAQEPLSYDEWYYKTYIQPEAEAAKKKKLESAYSIAPQTYTSGPGYNYTINPYAYDY